MSATNYTPIYLYNSGTATNTPSAANLGAGELAINYADGKLFYKDGSAAVQVIAWKTTPTTAGGTGLTSYTAGDLPYYASGSALSKLGIGTNGYVLQSNGSAPTWVAQSTLSVGTATNATNTAITDNTSSSATWYPTIVSATTGNLPQTTSSTKLSFVPSTGTLTTTYLTPTNALGVAYGGTGLTTTPSNGQIDIGNGTGFTRATLTAGSGISVTNASGAITIANTQNTGPAFSAYANATQSISNATFTKIQFQTKEFDTNSNFDSTTNYRFTPTVAGYYFISGTINFNGTLATSQNLISIYKNGSEFKRGGQVLTNAANNATGITVTALIQFNGSTDYVEIYGYQANGISVNTSATLTYFEGFMARTI